MGFRSDCCASQPDMWYAFDEQMAQHGSKSTIPCGCAGVLQNERARLSRVLEPGEAALCRPARGVCGGPQARQGSDAAAPSAAEHLGPHLQHTAAEDVQGGIKLAAVSCFKTPVTD